MRRDNVAVLFVEAPQHVEDEGAIINNLAKVAQIVSHALHLAAIVRDGEVALLEDAEIGVEVERPSFVVAAEMLVEAQPGDAGRVVANAHGLLKFGGQGAEEPRADDGIHAAPRGDGRDLV